jgi:hypothetical protein
MPLQSARIVVTIPRSEKMKKTFIIKDESIIEKLVYFLRNWKESEPWEVIVRPYKADRSVSQNSLYWMWVTVVSNEIGLTKEEVHEDLKKRMLVPIYERDEPGYCEMVNSLRKLYTEGFREESKELHKQIVRLTSTTSATVKQFAEYLTEIERDMVGRGIFLPHPEDRYYEAIGTKQLV